MLGRTILNAEIHELAGTGRICWGALRGFKHWNEELVQHAWEPAGCQGWSRYTRAYFRAWNNPDGLPGCPQCLRPCVSHSFLDWDPNVSEPPASIKPLLWARVTSGRSKRCCALCRAMCFHAWRLLAALRVLSERALVMQSRKERTQLSVQYSGGPSRRGADVVYHKTKPKWAKHQQQQRQKITSGCREVCGWVSTTKRVNPCSWEGLGPGVGVVADGVQGILHTDGNQSGAWGEGGY